jgi:hypothetical protein
VGDHERGPLHPLDHVRHGEGLAGAGGSQKCLTAVAGAEALDELIDGLRLVALETVVGFDLVSHR